MKLLNLFIGQRDEYLCVYSESHIDIFEVSTGDWVQTVNLKKVCNVKFALASKKLYLEIHFNYL